MNNKIIKFQIFNRKLKFSSKNSQFLLKQVNLIKIQKMIFFNQKSMIIIIFSICIIELKISILLFWAFINENLSLNKKKFLKMMFMSMRRLSIRFKIFSKIIQIQVKREKCLNWVWKNWIKNTTPIRLTLLIVIYLNILLDKSRKDCINIQKVLVDSIITKNTKNNWF